MTVRKIKVLLVDDEEQFRVTTEKVMTRRGFEVITAGDGSQALKALATEPDVVVLDIKMPGLSGLDVLAQIKDAAPKLPVLMLTGHGSEAVAQEALVKGARDFLAKPCDIDLLASKINEAYRAEHGGYAEIERKVADVMVPFSEYTALPLGATVKEAVESLRESFFSKAAGQSIMETGHRSVLVTNGGGKVVGILAIVDLLQGMMPRYLDAPKPSTADTIQYSPMFWSGMFTRELRKLAARTVGELMSPAPRTIAAGANLMEAAYTMLQEDHRRLLVMEGGQTVGVLREQDLFFEMERLLQEG